MRRISILLVAMMLAAAGSTPALASEDDRLTPPAPPVYTGTDFQALYAYAVRNTLPGLEMQTGRHSITGNAAVDDRIWELALARGYLPQPTAAAGLVSAPVLMQPLAAEGWRSLGAEARQSGMGFVARSAYRSLATQRGMFIERLNGTSDAAIEAALRWAAPPGMSKHHGGYAIDFRYPDGTYGTFRASPGYAWLARDNFDVAKRHGWLPSYPDDVESQGPNPEPWEFVWVGTDLVLCGVPQPAAAIAGPAAALGMDIGRCPGGSQPAELPDWLGSVQGASSASR